MADSGDDRGRDRDRGRHLAEVLDATSDGTFDWDVATGHVEFSDRWLRTLGYTRDEVAGAGSSVTFWDSIIHPDDAIGRRAALDDHFDGRVDAYVCEKRLRRGDGSYRWFLARGRVVERSADGSARRMVGTYVDIEDRKRHERKVEASERRLRTIADAIPPQIALVRPNRTYEFVNAAYAAQFGRSVDSIIGQKIEEVMGPENYARIRPHLDRGLGGATVEYEVRMELPEVDQSHGTRQAFKRVTCVPQLDDSGRVEGLHVVITDITEIRRREDEASTERGRLELALRTGAIGLWDWDLVSDRIQWSDSFYELIGRRREADPPSVHRFIHSVHPDDVATLREAIERNRSGETDEHETEFRYRRGDGSMVWLAARGRVFRRDGGRPTRMTGSIIDISERKRREAEAAFRASLIAAVTPVATTRELVDIVAKALVRHFDATRCLLIEETEPAEADALDGTTTRRVFGDPSDEDARVADALSPIWRDSDAEAGGVETIDGVDDTGGRRLAPEQDSPRSAGVRRVLWARRDRGDGRRFVAVLTADAPRTWGEHEREVLRELTTLVDLRLQRAATEENLRRSESFTRTVLDSTPDCVKVLDVDGRVIRMNAAGLNLMEVDCPDDVVGRRWPEIYPPEAAAIAEQALQEATEEGHTNVEMQAPTMRGRPRWWDTSITSVRDDDGRVVQFVAVSRDVTQRRETEDALRRSRADLQLGLRVADAVMGRIDYVTGDVTLSADAARLYGLGESATTVTLDTLHARIHPAERPSVLDHAAEVRRGRSEGNFVARHRVLRDNGKTRWLDVRKQMFFDRDPDGDGPPRATHAILAARDITEEKRSERKIRLNEQRLRLAAAAAGFGTLYADVRRGMTTFSPELLAAVGRPSPRALVLPIEDMPPFVHPDDVDRMRRFFRDHVMTIGDAPPIEHRVVRDDGSVGWVRLQSRTIGGRPEGGGPGGEGDAAEVPVEIIGTVLDVTDQHRREEELVEARHQAESANQSKSAFLANMSHEIRTPMTAILGYVDLVEEEVADPTLRDHLNTVRRNGGFLLDIINDILDLSKIEAGKLDVQAEWFDPAGVVEDVRSIMAVRAADKDLRLDVEYRGDLPERIHSDPKRLKQILINLVGNAVKFTEAGGVDIVVSCRERDGETFLHLGVIDTGIGISDQQLRRLFQPFTQADGSVGRRFGGTGLGLTISRRLADLMGGDIVVSSEPDRGSRFEAWVRAGRTDRLNMIRRDGTGATVAAEPTADAASIDLTGVNVLVTDDRPDIRFLTRRLLTRAGATVDEAEDGGQCLDKVIGAIADYRPYDLIMLDMQMPVLDGYQTAEKLRAGGYRGVIIALTADAMQGDMKRCLRVGCDAYLSKPIDAEKFLGLVREKTRRG